MFDLLFMLAQAGGTGAPSVSNAVVSRVTAGACSGGAPSPSAEIQIAWTLTNPDPAAYKIAIYQNGISFTLLTGDSTSLLNEITGYVEGGLFSQFDADWTYRVDVVRNSDSVVVSTTTSNRWNVLYGSC